MQDSYQVVIAGAGPTGLVLANLLGMRGIRTLVLERNPATVQEPRAVSIDDESLRAMQAIGLVDKVLKEIVPGYGAWYYSPAGSIFARVNPATREFGFPRRSAFRQPVLEGQLRDGVTRFACVDMLFRHELTGIDAHAERVDLTVRTDSGEVRRVRTEWLVGSDGGRSQVRDWIGATMQGTTFAERWLIVDLAGTPDRFRHTRVYCDPTRPAISLPGPRGTRRYEFMMHPGERDEDILDEARVRDMIARRIPGDRDLPIVRKVVYTFHARMATHWRSGRVLLAGDAAHLTPPFAGQGMNSGVRDSLNLGWKLAAAVSGNLGPALLESYEPERKPHAWSLIEMALTIGRFMQPKSAAGALFNQALLRLLSIFPAARDYVLQMKFKPKPRYRSGFVVDDGLPDKVALAGRLFPQPQIEHPERGHLLLDELLGTGFSLLVFGPLPGDRAPSLDLPVELAARRVWVLPKDYNFPWPMEFAGYDEVIRDAEGAIDAALRPAGACAVLLRPDRHVLALIPLSAPKIAEAAIRRLVEATRH